MCTVVPEWRVLSTDFSNNRISFREKYLDDHWKEKIIPHIRRRKYTSKSLNMPERKNTPVLRTKTISGSY